MYWWDYILMYPIETVAVFSIAIIGYVVYLELSKYWYKPLYISHYGKWRILRYVGRIVDMEGKKKWTGINPLFGENVKDRVFECKIKIRGQPTRNINLSSDIIAEIHKRKIVMDAKYLLWIADTRTYELSSIRPKAYHVNPLNLEKYHLHKIDCMDIKANKSAIVSPPVIHNSLLSQHLPLEFGEYDEEIDERIAETANYIFDEEQLGGYSLYNEVLAEQKKRKQKKKEI